MCVNLRVSVIMSRMGVEKQIMGCKVSFKLPEMSATGQVIVDSLVLIMSLTTLLDIMWSFCSIWGRDDKNNQCCDDSAMK